MQVRRPTWGNWEACAWGILCVLVHTSRDRVERKRFFVLIGKRCKQFLKIFRKMRNFCSDLCWKRKFLLEENLFRNLLWVSYTFMANFFFKVALMFAIFCEIEHDCSVNPTSRTWRAWHPPPPPPPPTVLAECTHRCPWTSSSLFHLYFIALIHTYVKMQ